MFRIAQGIGPDAADVTLLRRVACVSEGFYSGLNRWSAGLVPQHDAQERVVDLQAAVVPMKPSFRNLFMKKFTRERVVPTISANVSCETLGKVR